ncbi:MAG: hypothetical protein IPH28_24810 [Cytophagaceae bacterium]|nr:hypothetical protein [Cytophagaceae bacterium]
MDKIIIKIADDYTKTPGVREEIEGDFPGEEFLKKAIASQIQTSIVRKEIAFY